MSAERAIERIGAGRIVAILRGDFKGREAEMAEILAGAGIAALEVTLNSPGALASIAALAESLGSRIAIGAGTVMTPAQAAQVAAAGGTFVVSPDCNPAVIAETKRRGMASLPGCFTPTEIVAALGAGADAAKLFPASALGPAFVKAMRGPLPGARLVPTGGIDPAAAHEYIAAGAWAVGVGSELAGADALQPGGMERLKERAEAFVAAVRTK